ncbi:TPA: cytoskeleton protein RodZ [Vibrio parahaemolyticus]|uniref:cytoskeleton protein RodZ n=1 Tax=Vibrio parahaemolyticus TaxID=670 RepID=UPI000415AE12|nr:cytoskeleton protein RodZ [Vibrio parahaemolyticus]EGQ7777687.1 cytoskeleton protein RodZ [Vibrio parahaemolyticus]EGQ8397829.1 cytoskeleton protein RodZ [Vibrio parahaemolyticus]EGQ9049042.1 cytoskeleton protein RodZ [Vibrio parahaemolyticus]EGQ9145052.1 helix-turn-helix domain-containing protein [Vibrio parahaemolyticus]EGQ9588176.1 cytoskeleton protein RodZ [Vibrio parahaemolyticus]
MTEHENTNEVPLSIEAGTLLKNKRESLGMTQKQVADRLRLRVSVIEDIENNRFESQQVATFTRGYLRSYAKFVGLDEKVVLVALEQTADVKPKEQEIEMQSFSRKTKHEKHNSRIMLLTWVIAIVIIGISAAWWWQNQQENSLAQVVAEANVETSQPSADEIADIDLMTEEELIASTPAELAVSNNTASESSINAAQTDEVVPAETEESTTEATQEPVAVIEAAEEVQEASPVVPEGMTLLTMKFKADCWIQVKDTNGKTLVSGTQKPGQDVELTGKAPFKVILGAPEGVTMTFASEPVDLSGYTSGKVARFTLPL